MNEAGGLGLACSWRAGPGGLADRVGDSDYFADSIVMPIKLVCREPITRAVRLTVFGALSNGCHSDRR